MLIEILQPLSWYSALPHLEIGHWFKLLDLEESGEVAFEEFMGGALRLTGAVLPFTPQC